MVKENKQPTVNELQKQIEELTRMVKSGTQPAIIKKNADITEELHYYADNAMWPELKNRYYQGKCRHNAFIGADVLITKAVLSGDLQLILDMIKDGADIDLKGATTLEHAAGTLGGHSGRDLIKQRGRNPIEHKSLKSLHNISGIGLPPLAQTKRNNVALYDYFINPDGKGFVSYCNRFKKGNLSKKASCIGNEDTRHLDECMMCSIYILKKQKKKELLKKKEE